MEKPKREVITGIPKDKLADVVADYQSVGARVETEVQKDGNYTVIAYFEQAQRRTKK